MTENPAKREAITQLFDSARVNGVAYLLAIIALGSATIPELVDMTGDERHTIGRYLARLESREFLIRVPSGRYERWFPTPKALALFGIRSLETLPSPNPLNIMEEGILPSTLSSSSDPGSDLDQPDQDPEEEGTSRKEKCLEWVSRYNLTGHVAQQLVADAWLTPLRLVAWMLKVKAMQRAGFEFHKSPEAYAIQCLRRHHEPPADYLCAAERHLQGGDHAPETEEAESSNDFSRSAVDLPRLPSPDPSREAQKIWQVALGELQIQMTRPTFDTFIKPIILVAYDPSHSPDPLFTLAVENEHLRDWLDTKLRTSITRALAGITNRAVVVRIITWSEASSNDFSRLNPIQRSMS